MAPCLLRADLSFMKTVTGSSKVLHGTHGQTLFFLHLSVTNFSWLQSHMKKEKTVADASMSLGYQLYLALQLSFFTIKRSKLVLFNYISYSFKYLFTWQLNSSLYPCFVSVVITIKEQGKMNISNRLKVTWLNAKLTQQPGASFDKSGQLTCGGGGESMTGTGSLATDSSSLESESDAI